MSTTPPYLLNGVRNDSNKNSAEKRKRERAEESDKESNEESNDNSEEESDKESDEESDEESELNSADETFQCPDCDEHYVGEPICGCAYDRYVEEHGEEDSDEDSNKEVEEEIVDEVEVSKMWKYVCRWTGLWLRYRGIPFGKSKGEKNVEKSE